MKAAAQLFKAHFKRRGTYRCSHCNKHTPRSSAKVCPDCDDVLCPLCVTFNEKCECEKGVTS